MAECAVYLPNSRRSERRKTSTILRVYYKLRIYRKGTANEVHPRALQEIFEVVQGKPEEMVISTVMLRSMQQAKYDPESLGHFGCQRIFIPILHRRFGVIQI